MKDPGARVDDLAATPTRSESADLAEDTAVKGLVGEVLDALLGAVGALDVHPGIGVGDSALFSRLLCQESGSHPEGVSPQVFVQEAVIVPFRCNCSAIEMRTVTPR